MRPRALSSAMVLLILAVFAGPANAAYLHNFSCKDCHKPDVSLTGVNGTGAGANLCLTCHKDSPPSKTFLDTLNHTATGFFYPTDVSNAMSTTNSTGTSHHWSTRDISAAAGAVAPATTFYNSRYGVSFGKVTCTRCHNPHGLPTNTTQMRPTAKSDICVECHVSWDNSNANAYLTHPVGIDYASFAGTAGYKSAVDPTNFNPTLINQAPNSTVGLISGKIYCSSCHRPHFADSDASTVDGKGQVLNNGDGHQLRSDGPLITGATVLETAQKRSNLCQACHTHKIHGTATNRIGCLDCHSGHSYNGGTPNYFVLRDRTTKPPATQITDLRFLDPTTLHGGAKSVAAVWAGEVVGDTAGYCERCHGQLTNMPGATLRPNHVEGENCRQCHAHNGTTYSFQASGCDGCHGSPPRTLTQGSPDGYAYVAGPPVISYAAQTFYKPENATPHASHSGTGSDYNFACGVCHNAADFDATHNKGTFQDVLLAGGTWDEKVKPTGSSLNPTYTPSNPNGAGTCTQVACHTNGGKRTGDATRTYKVPASAPFWKNGINTITTCNVCHGNDAASMALAQRDNSDRHNVHLTKGYSCNICHKDTAQNATTLVDGAAGTKHVNGTHDVAFDTSGFITVGPTPYTSNTGVCAVYCHSNGATRVSPDWDLAATGACGTCHQYSNAGVATGSGPALGGSHAKHLYAADGGVQLACTVCHTNAGAAGSANTDHVNGTVNFVANYQTTVCNPCHGAQNGNSTAGHPDRQPVWTSATSVDCTTCHAGILAYVAVGQTVAPTTGIHAAARISANQHDDSFNNGSAGTADCETCHTASPSSAHANGTVNNSWPSITLAANVGFLDGGTPTCGPVSGLAGCHDDGGAWKRKWSATAQNNDGTECANCHGDFAAGFVTGMSLRHQTVSSGDAGGQIEAEHDDTGGTLKCYICHAYGHANYTAGMHRDGNIQINSNATFLDNGATVYCTGCHANNDNTADGGHLFQDTNNADGADGGLNRWGRSPITGPQADCNSCHTSAGRNHSGATTESLSTHNLHTGSVFAIGACTQCHPHDGISVPPGTGVHNVGGTVNFGNKIPNTYNYSVADFGGNCSTNTCHDTDDVEEEWHNGGLGADACADCHNSGKTGAFSGLSAYPPTSAKHAEHIANNWGVPNDCADCHGTGAATGTHTGHKQNNGIQTAAALAYASATQTCTNTCHTANTTGDWTALGSLACADCHAATGKSLDQGGYPPVSAQHTIHIANNTYVPGDCDDCHGVNAVSGTHTGHLNNIKTTANKISLYTQANGTCTNSCHIANTANDWSGSGVLACTDCHGSGKVTTPSLDRAWPPSTGAHIKHTGNTNYVAANCVDCHNNNTTTHSALNNVVTAATGAKLTANPANGSCTNTCHTAAQAGDWTGGAAAVTCLDCHSGTYVGGNNVAKGFNATPATGLHTGTLITSANTHDDSFNDGNAGTATCATCHTATPSTNHLNGTFTNTWGTAAPSINFNASVGFTDGATPTCGPTGAGYVTCHDDGGVWKRKWNISAKVNDDTRCANCHGDFDSGFVTGMSARHQTASTGDADGQVGSGHDGSANGKCSICHNYIKGDTTYYNIANAPTGQHRDGSIQINSSVGFVDGGANVGCSKCHADADGTADEGHQFVDTTARWTRLLQAGPPVTCGSCHGYPPDPADGKAEISVEGKGAHTKHVNHIAARAGKTLDAANDTFTGPTSTAVCGVCHNVSVGSNHSTAGGPRNLLIPAGTYQFGPSAPSFDGTVGQPSVSDPKSCSSVSCHFKPTPVWQ